MHNDENNETQSVSDNENNNDGSSEKGTSQSNAAPSTKSSGRYYSFAPNSRFQALIEAKTDVWICHCRFGSMSISGLFFTTTGEYSPKDDIIIKTEMGVEIGFVITTPKPFNISEDAKTPEVLGEVLRHAQKEDLSRWDYIIDELQKQEFNTCREIIRNHNLPMKLVDVEHLFGGDRIIFYFLADNRVDFRALVRDLSKEFKTRIEMRQIGVRDEARLLADYEHCGRPLCCKTFMTELKPVSMKMAKQQKTTLDPAKISGRCGRLMCCLRFEDEAYAYLRRKLPKIGSTVFSKEASGEVINVNLLRESVLVRDENNNQVWISASDITKVAGNNQRKH